MKKKILKNIVAFAMILLIVAPVFALVSTNALAANVDVWGEDDGIGEDTIQSSLGLGNEDPRTIAASVINILLGFLGIIAVIIILIGGFKWMTAGGNEDKTTEARNLISAGVIGLIIILAAFGIAKFVIDQLLTATGAST